MKKPIYRKSIVNITSGERVQVYPFHTCWLGAQLLFQTPFQEGVTAVNRSAGIPCLVELTF